MIKPVDPIAYYYPHFNERLIERYGFDISLDEYLELNNQELDLLYILTPNKRVGKINFKGRDILVVKCLASKCLNTCLINDGLLPVPRTYKKRGITQQQFKIDLEIALEKIDVLVDIFRRVDKRDFFVNKPLGYPDWMYSAAYHKIEGNENHLKHFLLRVVRNLYRK